MAKIFSIRPVQPAADAADPPADEGTPPGWRDVLRLLEADALLGDAADGIAYGERSERLMRRLVERYGFDRLPRTFAELFGLVDYCDSLDAARGSGMMAPDQLAQWQEASFAVWRRKQPQRMPAIELYCAGDLAGLRALHAREDTLAALGRGEAASAEPPPGA